MSSPTLEASDYVNGTTTNNWTSAGLSSANTGNIFAVAVTTNGGPVTSVSGSSIGAFTFVGKDPASVNDTEIWYGVSASAISGETVNVQTTSNAFFSARVALFSGCDTTTVIDGTVVTGAPTPENYTTGTDGSVIFASFRFGTSSPDAGSGFTRIGALGGYAVAEYQVIATAGTTSVTTNPLGGNGGVIIAFLAASGGGTTIALNATSFAFTGQSQLIAQTLSLGSASFNFTPQAVTLVSTIALGAAAFAFTAQPITVLLTVALTAAAFAFTGQALTVIPNTLLQLGVATFSMIGRRITIVAAGIASAYDFIVRWRRRQRR